MNSDRIKEIQQSTAYPDSISVQQALLQVWNECAQEKTTSVPSVEEITESDIDPRYYEWIEKIMANTNKPTTSVPSVEEIRSFLMNAPLTTQALAESLHKWITERIK